MSLRTRIHGFTAWVNLRLKPSEQLMNNVLMDLLRGTSMKNLLHSLTGSEITRLQSFDNLTHDQKVIRVQWMVDELKKCKVIPDDVFVDTRLFAMRSAEHIFELLWRLVCHDIWFVWERAEYLQHDSDEVLAQVPFKWVPEAPPPKRKVKVKTTTSLLSGFASASILREELPSDEPDPMATYDPFPNSDFMKQFKTRTLEDGKYPPPEDCIMEMVKAQLMSVAEGRKVQCHRIDDLADSRVLCALVNSFVPNTFTTEVLLNDRWTINLVLRSTEKMFYMHSPFDSEDLLEADTMSVCAFFCTFFMLAYKYRQSYSVVSWLDHIRMLRQQWETELAQIPRDCVDEDTTDHRDKVESELTHINKAIKEIETNFDMDFCNQWLEHVDTVVKETHEEIRQKFRDRFETLVVPRNITVGHLCLSLGINLSLTNGSGFYLAEGSKKEAVSDTRKVVLQEKMTGAYFDDFTGKRKDTTRKLLGLPAKGSVDIIPEKFTFFKMFVEAPSKNKSLRFGSVFLYQVFPGNTVTWQKVYLRAVKDNELETVKRIVTFFKSNLAFINCQEPHTGNSTLHWACKLGHYDVVLYLLENGANIDQKNSSNQTPLFLACDAWQKDIAHLLIEWGCDVHVKGPRGQTAFETVRNEEFREELISMYEMYSMWVPRVIEGDTELLAKLIEDHASGMKRFSDLRSRCINGSTLLHTAAYFGCAPLVGQLLALGVDVNLRDYKGATPLHRAKDVECIKLLLNAGALPSALDTGHNTPLHVKCYGDTDESSDTASVEVLLKAGAKLAIRNNRSLLPIHCAAMQGRTDLISMLLRSDSDGVIRKALAEEGTTAPPSVLYLAVANESMDCAEWLVQHDFGFKFDEEDHLLQKIVAEQITMTDRIGAVTFLLRQGADVNREYEGCNTLLHFAACMSGPTDVLELLIDSGASVDRKNMDGSGPLTVACQANNKFACTLLLDRGANVRAKNIHGMTAFDFVVDYEEWIECGYFNDEIRARLKAYSLKHARDLVRAITKKVKHPAHYIMKVPSMKPGVHQVNLAPWNSQVPRVSSAGAKGFPAFRKPPMRRQLGYVKAQ